MEKDLLSNCEVVMSREEYLKKMRDRFEFHAKQFEMNLERDDIGAYVHDITHSHFVFFSTAYQIDESKK